MIAPFWQKKRTPPMNKRILFLTIGWIALFELCVFTFRCAIADFPWGAEQEPAHTIVYDSCEYVRINDYHVYAHKGNCRFCADRRRRELKDLVEQLKAE